MSAVKQLEMRAAVFAALGDPTRLRLVTKLCEDSPQSISQLSQGSDLTRQGITRHLDALENAGLVINIRRGRESLYSLESAPIEDIQKYLENMSKQWDNILSRFKKFVEEE
ncbi:MAG: helix-turn-helix transcriptional regulator [Rhizobacter sp.]|nr:helix-turn-helix transcriptional regulator [Bacteriovorax sp.]